MASNGGSDSRLATVPSHSIADFSQAALILPQRQLSYQNHPTSSSVDDIEDQGIDLASPGDESADGALDHTVKQRLQDSNAQLRQELAGLSAKLAQLQRFEQELDSIREQHDVLQESTDKRERLEQAFRTRLEDKCRRLEQANKQLKAKLEDARRQTDSSSMHARNEMQEEVMRHDRAIHTLTAQCASGQDECNRLRRQVGQLADRAQAIPQLESHVSANEQQLKTLQEELTHQASLAQKVQDVEAAVEEMMLLGEQNMIHRQKHREVLDNEITTLRLQIQGAAFLSNQDGPGGSAGPNAVTPQQILDFESLLERREIRIQQLHDEVAKWRQLYCEELNVGATLDRTEPMPTLTRSLADINATSRADQQLEMTTAHLLQANRRVIDMESAVKHLRQIMSDLRAEIEASRSGQESHSNNLRNTAMPMTGDGLRRSSRDLASPLASTSASPPSSPATRSRPPYGSEEHV